jgi:hypothetical protein
VRRVVLTAAAVVLAACGGSERRPTAQRAAPPGKHIAPAGEKAIWGPATSRSFAVYRDLGVSIYQTSMVWPDVAPTRPADPRDPGDPAYRWPEAMDRAVRLARASHMRISVELTGSPGWANGGRAQNVAPARPADFADFAAAAARRYPSIHLWAIWGEPVRRANFDAGDEARAPGAYARILDAAYAALKGVDPRNLVIGGDTETIGDVSPYDWIRHLRLPDGRPPRMDLFGHNPFSLREPAPNGTPLGHGHADFSNLGLLEGWLDRFLRGRAAGPARLPLFLLEYTAPTDHPNDEFNFWVDRSAQARWLAAALRIVRGDPRIAALAWISLYDDPPRPDGREADKGLLTLDGGRKPAYGVFKRG